MKDFEESINRYVYIYLPVDIISDRRLKESFHGRLQFFGVESLSKIYKLFTGTL